MMSVALATLAGCSCAPEVIACPPAAYTTEDLVECGCATPVPDGFATAILAGPGSFSASQTATVLLRGRLVTSGRTAGDGSLAILVTVPGRELETVSEPGGTGLDLEVVVNRTHAIVHVPSFETAVLTDSDFTFIETEVDVLSIRASVRAIEWTDCPGPTAPTPSPLHVYAANLTTGQTAVGPAPPLDTPFSVSISGVEGDLAIVAVLHENGGVSGCFYGNDVCCSCPGGGGHRSPFHGASCSARLRAAGTCRSRRPPVDAGADARADANIDAARPLDDADLDGDLPDNGPI